MGFGKNGHKGTFFWRNPQIFCKRTLTRPCQRGYERYNHRSYGLDFVSKFKAKIALEKFQMSENLPEAELRRLIQQQVLHELADVEVFHPNLPLPVRINRRGLKHCISRRYDHPRERLLVLPSLPELLAKAGYISKEDDNHVPPRPGIFIHKLQTAHQIVGKLYGIWLYIHETHNSLNFYDLGVIELPGQ